MTMPHEPLQQLVSARAGFPRLLIKHRRILVGMAILVLVLGLPPGTAIFVNAGVQIARIETVSGILSPGLILSLALLGIFPLAVRWGLARFHRQTRDPANFGSSSATTRSADPRHSVDPLLQEIQDRCTECGACQKNCAFLNRYGLPRTIAAELARAPLSHWNMAYECSLCGLCGAVCPEHLDPARMFLETRRRCVEAGQLDTSCYRAILGYENRGVSPLFSWYGLPEGCDTIFFPGCTLPGTRPAITRHLYRQLRASIPTLGLVLDCCAKPSHDLGREDRFHQLFDEMNEYLTAHGIRTVLTACPNCTRMFRQYGRGIQVRTVYETLFDDGNGVRAGAAGTVLGVHDPCGLRDDLSTQRAVRGLLTRMGYSLAEMKHRGKRTLCCGEGGMVSAVNPKFAEAWARIRGNEADGHKLITYCAGCAGFLNRVVPTVHIADLLYRPEAALDGDLKIARAPFTYWNRLRLKRRMQKEIRPKWQRTRPPLSNPTRDQA